MFEPFARAGQLRQGEVCPRGLLLDGGRKSVESMAARLGEPGGHRTLRPGAREGALYLHPERRLGVRPDDEVGQVRGAVDEVSLGPVVPGAVVERLCRGG
ncbi:transposase [Streptomyces sp. NPDC018059]|uniref:transposase n=1 Tax=Streptomyces sp. NPDC018059 TaxID=3365041 RepID=UPI0037AB32B2